jgi:hypothetical protein
VPKRRQLLLGLLISLAFPGAALALTTQPARSWTLLGAGKEGSDFQRQAGGRAQALQVKASASGVARSIITTGRPSRPRGNVGGGRGAVGRRGFLRPQPQEDRGEGPLNASSHRPIPHHPSRTTPRTLALSAGHAPGPTPGTKPQKKRPRLPNTDGVNNEVKTGGDLLSQALAGQVPSALRGLTALFGMGRGVSPSP